MKAPLKVGIVLGGNVVAAVVAGVVVANGPNAKDPGGMAAFGDLLYFLAVFSALGSVPTGFALWFLRPYRRFWNVLAAAAAAIALTGVCAASLYAMTASSKPDPASALYPWGQLSPLRMLVAPILAGAFGLAGILAPERRPRWVLLSAAAVETAVSAYAAIHWFISNRFT